MTISWLTNATDVSETALGDLAGTAAIRGEDLSFIDMAPLTRSRSGLHALALLSFADGFSVGVGLVVAALVQQALHGQRDLLGAFGSIVYVPVFMLVMAGYGLYRRAQRRLVSSSIPDFGAILHSLSFGTIITIFVADAVQRWSGAPTIHGGAVALGGVLALLMVPQARSAARSSPLAKKMPTARVLVVGSGQVARLVVQRLGRMDDISVIGSLDDSVYPMDEVPGCRRLGSLDQLIGTIEQHRINHVLVAFSATNEAKLAGLLRSVPSHVRISVVPRMFDLLTVRSEVSDLRGLPLVDVAPACLGPADRFVKRAIDLCVSGLGLLLVSPLMILIAVGVKMSSKGTVLFSQERTGRSQVPFRIHKFRTMYVEAERMKADLANEVDGPLFKVRKDPRITPLGRLLRKTSLDELPQLINVFKGDMSLVGPRPFVVSEASEIRGWASKRFEVRPGMTGLWQVSGRNDLPFDELCRLDYAYVASWSLWWDISILCRTPASVLQQDGAY